MQGELLYELKGKFTGAVEIGAVPEGMRINFPVAGDISGPKISGKIEGVDYVLIRADGVGLLHAHAVVTTDEGDPISVDVSGFATPTQEEGRYDLKEAVTFRTGSKKFAWLNTTQAVGEGFTNTKTGELYVKVLVPFPFKE